MKRLALMFAVVVLLTSAAGAQANNFITANVPFDFYVGENRMSAGEYRIAYYGATHDVLVITNRTQNEILVAMSFREGTTREVNPKLVFHNYGRSYFLASVVMARDIRELPQTHSEREFSAQLHPYQVTVVARLSK